MKTETFLKNIFQWGTLATIIATAVPDVAMAASIGRSVDEIVGNDLTTLPNMISAVAFIGGGVLAISGALKLKAHAENPAQEKLAPGLARLLVGGAIAALPFLVRTATDTLYLTDTAEYTALPSNF